MGWMLEGLIGGVGDAINSDANMRGERIKADEAEALAARTEIRRDDLAGKRAATTQALREEYDILTETRKNEPLMRVSEQARKFSQEQVPDVPKPVTELSGDFEGRAITTGVKGNYDELVKRAYAPGFAEEDRAPYLEQLAKQFGKDTQTGLINSAGKMRNRTTGEAMQAALDDAKMNNPMGYKLYNDNIAKPDREERGMAIKENKDRADQKFKDRSADAKDEANRVREYAVDQRAEASANRLEAMIARNGGGKDGTIEAFKIIDSDRKRLHDEEASLRNDAKLLSGNYEMSKEEKAQATAQINSAKAALAEKRKQADSDFNTLREKVGLPKVSSEPEAKPAPQSSGPIAPSSKAAFDALPSGSLFVNPADGKTYKKK